jgi:hypothetical protein
VYHHDRELSDAPAATVVHDPAVTGAEALLVEHEQEWGVLEHVDELA